MTTAMLTTSITSLPLLARGKVRDNYAVGEDRILMIATDRVSAFDVVMNEGIPGKGEILTQMALFWFDKLKDIIPNHLTGEDPLSVVTEAERDQVRGRSMLVKRLRPLPIEAVVRGYLAGSAWKEYQQTQSVSGIPLPPGLRHASKLPEPIFTPATKAEAGEHDENIDFERMSATVGAVCAETVRRISIALYSSATEFSETKGLAIADTKFEFGLNEQGLIVLMDEILTPDSTRYWLLKECGKSNHPAGYDKQFLRDWLEGARVGGQRWAKSAPPPKLPDDVICQMKQLYQGAMACLKM